MEFGSGSGFVLGFGCELGRGIWDLELNLVGVGGGLGSGGVPGAQMGSVRLANRARCGFVTCGRGEA